MTTSHPSDAGDPTPFDARRRAVRGAEELRRSFPAPGAVDRCAAILQSQCLALRDAPPTSLSDAVRLAAVARLRAGQVVLPPERFPLESPRVAPLLRRLASEVLDDPSPLGDVEAVVAPAMAAAALEDAAGVVAALEPLGWPARTALPLFREALKPELLRTSTPFTSLVGEAAQGKGRCPLCGRLPCAGNRDLVLCCSWCGLTWPWKGGSCVSCGSTDVRPLQVAAVVHGARLLRCQACAWVLELFLASPDPLVLSLHGVLAAPLALAARVQSGAGPAGGFPVF